MNKQVSVGLPTANIAINKSRVKVYNKQTDIPTVYLQKGTEFQIELFNPTTDVILCEIHLNNKQISQGGLVLNPGQRVFLDRYLDVAKKFKFDTYEVANTEEVKKAIEQNGDFKVRFYKEQTNFYLSNGINISSGSWDRTKWGGPHTGTPYYGNLTTNINYCNSDTGGITLDSSNITLTNSNYSGIVTCSASMDFLGDIQEPPMLKKRSFSKSFSKKSIETGRVEQGSYSDQKFTTVNKNWEYLPFHTIEYKLLPVSQKVNTVQDIMVANYCGNCGSKQKKGNNFCPNCGTRI